MFKVHNVSQALAEPLGGPFLYCYVKKSVAHKSKIIPIVSTLFCNHPT